MKFLIDAQLPRRLCTWLCESGHDTVHTLELPDGNRTTDAAIANLADAEGRVVVTKDSDFVRSWLVQGRPARLLVIATGNIANADLERLLHANLEAVVAALAEHRLVELGRNALLLRD